MTNDACDPKRIVRYYFKDLAAPKRHRVEQHIKQCRRCMARLAALAATFNNLADRSKDEDDESEDQP